MSGFHPTSAVNKNKKTQKLQDRLQVLGTLANAVDRFSRIGFLFYIEILQARKFCFREDCFPIDRPSSYIGVPVTIGLVHILHVPLLETTRVLCEILQRIFSSVNYPEDIHFHSDILRIKFLQHQIIRDLSFYSLKLKRVVMISETNTRFVA